MGLTAGGLALLYIVLKVVDDVWRCKIDHLVSFRSLQRRSVVLVASLFLVPYLRSESTTVVYSKAADEPLCGKACCLLADPAS